MTPTPRDAIAQAIAALEPFAQTADCDNGSEHSSAATAMHERPITVGHLRAAKAALASLRSLAPAPADVGRVAIWSGEHNAYWRANSAGYTMDIRSIGSYSHADALARTKHCEPEKMIELIPFPAPADQNDAGRNAVIEEVAAPIVQAYEEACDAIADLKSQGGAVPRESECAVISLDALEPFVKFIASLRALTAAPAETVGQEWRCFHCDETFTTKEAAREHFGSDESCESACKIDIAEYRRLEEQQRACLAECCAEAKRYHAAEDDRRRALVAEEQKGYDKGVADMRAEALPAADREAIREAKAWIEQTCIAYEWEPPPVLAKLTAALALSGEG